IPFGALPDPAGSDRESVPMVVAHEVTNEVSASILVALHNRPARGREALKTIAVFGDPVFERDDPRFTRGSQQVASAEARDFTQEDSLSRALRSVDVMNGAGEIPRLIASSAEAAAIASLVPKNSRLQAIGFEASKARVMSSDLSQYRIIHLATHGIIGVDNPESSGLVLSLFDRQGRPQDGFLQLSDIYSLNLPADLVVLSACETGLGKPITGEGIIGLTRGFMHSGAARVMSSLWSVNDEATAE